MLWCVWLGCTVAPDDTGSGPSAPAACATVDADGDGSDACFDCDDGDAGRGPSGVETCDGVDNDCDGSLHRDEVDADGDGVYDCAACDQGGYWLATRGLVGTELTDALHDLSGRQACGDYGVATEFMFLTLDNVESAVECVYTGRVVAVTSEKPDSDDMNTEHTWPQSLGAEEVPAKCDLNHLYPTDSASNSVRSAYPLGVVTGSVDWEEGGSRLGAGAGGLVFEPRDPHKGNAARSILYFAMRYRLTPQEDVATLIAWHDADPPDAEEVLRALAIGAEQGAGNPYVLCPDFVGL